MSQVVESPLEAGRAAVLRRDWDTAYPLLQEADSAGDLGPDDLGLDDLRHDHTAIGALMPGCGSYPSIATSSKVKSSIELMLEFRTSLGSGRGSRLSCSLA